MGSKLRQRLLTGTTDSNQQCVTTRVGNNTTDPADVLERILEQHQVHHRIRFVVLRESLLQNLGQALEALHLVVDLVPKTPRKVREDKWLSVLLLVVVRKVANLEELVCNRLHVLVVRGEVSLGHQTIGVHTFGLVKPKPAQLDWVVKLLGIRHEDTLEHVREVTNGKLVVEVNRSLPESGHNLVVVGQRTLDNLRSQLLAVIAEVLQVTVQERTVDLHQRVLPGEIHGQGHEQALQTRVDDERTGCGVHRGDVLSVVDVLLCQLGAVIPVIPSKMLTNV
mmetsp:Transcript_30311/g.36798  ORF Transcript_30311/g.36798 Transcript_30311/m.36798 type:complete len:280 (-) Transcript_30311:4309-5148(-)